MIAIPIDGVPKNPSYREIDIDELAILGWQYWGWSRLGLGSLEVGMAALLAKWYRKKKEVGIRAQLVIPPELILRATDIFREDSLTKNFITRLIDKVWIDEDIKTVGIDCPWFLFASPDFITCGETDLAGVYYSAGTAP